MASKVDEAQLPLAFDPEARYDADVRRLIARLALALGVAGVTDRDFRCRWSCRAWATLRVRAEGAEFCLRVEGAEASDAELGVMEILAQNVDALAAKVQNGERLADVLGPWRIEGKAPSE